MGANEWAKRLGINDAASLETFKQKFSQLEDAAKECPVPPKDGSRCALCRRKVMLDTRFKELCNGLCSAGGSTKSTKKTINAVNSASKILEIYRSLPAAGAGAAPLRNIDESDGGIVGLSRLGESRDSDSNFQILCRSEQCQRACPEGGFCSRRRCDAKRAARRTVLLLSRRWSLAASRRQANDERVSAAENPDRFLGEHDGEPREAAGAAAEEFVGGRVLVVEGRRGGVAQVRRRGRRREVLARLRARGDRGPEDAEVLHGARPAGHEDPAGAAPEALEQPGRACGVT